MSLSATHRALLATSLVLGLTACAGHGVRTHGTNAPPAVTVTVERGDRTFSTAAGVRLRDDLVATSSRSVDRVPEWSGLWVTGEALRARASTWVAGHRGGIDLALLKVFVEPGTAPLMNDTPVCTTSPSRLVVSVPDQKPPFPAEVDGESLQVNAPASTPGHWNSALSTTPWKHSPPTCSASGRSRSSPTTWLSQGGCTTCSAVS